ncbi:MAG: hypothetical protein AAB505_01500, partial [Patescibacteria group bacterium]
MARKRRCSLVSLKISGGSFRKPVDGLGDIPFWCFYLLRYLAEDQSRKLVITVGGGNIIRKQNFLRSIAFLSSIKFAGDGQLRVMDQQPHKELDKMGMLATNVNAQWLTWLINEAIDQNRESSTYGCLSSRKAVFLTSFAPENQDQLYGVGRARDELGEGNIVVLGG